MEPLDEEKMLAEENVMPGTTLTVVAVNQAAEDEKEAAECNNDIVLAAYFGHLGAVRHLLRFRGLVPWPRGARAEVDARNDYGETPLHWAAGNGQVETVKLLLEAKASVTVKDNKGQTRLCLAQTDGHSEIVQQHEAPRFAHGVPSHVDDFAHRISPGSCMAMRVAPTLQARHFMAW